MSDIYDELLDIVRNESDLEEFLTHENKWEYLYNLSRIRWNILEWYEFDSKARLLEIGSQCGALTGFFCERVREVIALEEDDRKNRVNEARNGVKSNLKILKTDSYLTDVIGLKDELFDYITVIGDVSFEKIEFAKNHLAKEGILIIVNDNKYGVRNWSSDGIPDVIDRDKIEFSLNNTGFKIEEVYYPVPDYVLPLEIYSGENIPGKGFFNSNSPAYKDDRVVFMNEVKLMDELNSDNKLESFVNSYILICRM